MLPLLRLIWTLIKIGLGLVLGLILLVGYGIYANGAAERNGREFCDSLVSTGNFEAALAQAQREGIRFYKTEQPESYRFVFQGWVFNAGICQAEVEGTAIRSVRFWMETD